jgi:L-threonylcarbamoyladenylate synthase
LASLQNILDRKLDQAVAAVKQGGLIIYPTDTVYGLGCDPSNHEAVQRLVRAKHRTKTSLPVLLESISRAEKVGHFRNLSLLLAKKFWPGPLTIVVPSKKPLRGVTDETGCVGLRIPDHEIAMKLITRSGGALIGTSANLSGGKSPNTVHDIPKVLKSSVDVVIDGGSTGGGESTVVKMFGEELIVIRKGQISRAEIIRELSSGDKSRAE